MKWRDTTYRASYVVKRICAELGADPVKVWDIVDGEFDIEPGAEMSAEDARYLSEVVMAAMKGSGKPKEKAGQDNDLLDKKQAAALLKIHINTLDEERRAGRIAYIQRRPGGRVWFTRKAIHDYLTKSTHQALPERCLRETYRKRRAS